MKKKYSQPRNSGVSRRAVLRGMGGFCIALPFMEIFSKTSHAQASSVPKRFMIGFGGTSTGRDGAGYDAIVPDSQGAFEGRLTRGLAPLGDLGMTDSISLVSGLLVPWGNSPPPGGISGRQWHDQGGAKAAILSGKPPSGSGTGGSFAAPTCDWVAAETLAGPTADTRPVLTYRVQPEWYRGSNGAGDERGIISARRSGGRLQHVTPQHSPQSAYRDLFTGFAPPDAQEAEAAKRLLNRRKSVIDLVRGDTERLLPKLGNADKIRLERHFDELRGLENRLEDVKLPDGSSCKILPDPGRDPAIGATSSDGSDQGAYSNEELRATVLTDLIHMAFVCDLSRVASVCYTMTQCFMNLRPLFPNLGLDVHSMGHERGGSAEGMADAIGWHLKHFARLAQKLRDTEDVDGSSMLDNTAMVLGFEGGWGYSPSLGRDNDTHSSENMIMFIGGKAGGLNQSGGRHVRAEGEHPTKVINTALKAVGVSAEMGDVSGTIGGLTG